MEGILNYIKIHYKFFVLIGIITVLYYTLYFIVLGFPKINILKRIKIFNSFKSNNKFFNIFENSKAARVSIEPASDEILIDDDNGNWEAALEALEEQSLLFESENKIDNLLNEKGINLPKNDND